MANSTEPPVNIRVEITPGKLSTMELPREAVARYGLVKFKLLADGTILPVWKSWCATVRITRDLPKRLPAGYAIVQALNRVIQAP